MQKNSTRKLCGLATVGSLFLFTAAAFAQSQPEIPSPATGAGLTADPPALSFRRIRSPQRQAVKLAEIQRAANHIAAGDALLRQGNADGAIREYQQSLRITGSPGVRAKIGNALATGGQMNEGLAQYRLALANTPLPDTNIALNMALLLARMRQYDEAITLYRVGMRLPIAPNRLTGALGGTPLTPGYAAYQRALSREASTYSIFDITFSPSAFDMPLFEAAVCTALGKKRYGWPDALEQFDQAIRLSPNFAPAYLYRGDALELRGNRAEARTMYERARALGTGEVARRAQEALNRVNRRR